MVPRRPFSERAFGDDDHVTRHQHHVGLAVALLEQIAQAVGRARSRFIEWMRIARQEGVEALLGRHQGRGRQAQVQGAAGGQIPARDVRQRVLDLRSAAMDDDGAQPGIPKEDDVLRERGLQGEQHARHATEGGTQPEGQQLIRDLVKHCDVFIENFKVGDMARYGLDYASLSAINPKLVYCSVTGFGQTGPYKDRAGYDYAVQGIGGLMSITGERDDLGGGPQKVGVAVADLFTGMYATVGILAALRHAERTGQGQHVDMALLDVQVAMLANLGANYLVSGKVPGRAGNAHQNIVPYQVFEVADGHVILAVGNDEQFRRFCGVAGCAELAADARFARNADRVRHRDALVPAEDLWAAPRSLGRVFACAEQTVEHRPDVWRSKSRLRRKADLPRLAPSRSGHGFHRDLRRR